MKPLRKKMKVESEGPVILHLDHSVSSPMLQQKIQSNPYTLHSLRLVKERKIKLQDKGEWKYLGECPKYGLILTNVNKQQSNILFLNVESGIVSHIIPIAKIPLWEMYGACVELGETDHVMWVSKGCMTKMSLNGQVIWQKMLSTPYSSVVHDFVNNKLITCNQEGSLSFVESKNGLVDNVIQMDSPFVSCLGKDGRLFVLCTHVNKGRLIRRCSPKHSACIMVLHGKDYSQCKKLTDLPNNREYISMGIDSSGDLVMCSRGNEFFISIVDSQHGRVKVDSKIIILDNAGYFGAGKYIANKKNNNIKLYSPVMNSEHFPLIWKKEMHDRMKKMNAQVPLVCNSIIYKDQIIPKTLLWFINSKWGENNWLKYCNQFNELEDSEEECMEDEDDAGCELEVDSMSFHMDPIFEIDDLIPRFIEEWLEEEENEDVILLGGFKHQQARVKCNYFLASKMSECTENNLPLLLVNVHSGSVTPISAVSFLSHCKPVLGIIQEQYSTSTVGIIGVDYLDIYKKLNKNGVIKNGKIDSNVLLECYRSMNEKAITTLSNIPNETQLTEIKIGGSSFLCRDLIVLSYKYDWEAIDYIARTSCYVEFDSD